MTSEQDHARTTPALADLGELLVRLLHIRTLPVGMKLFEDVEEMRRIPGLRTPPVNKTFTTCQLVTQSRVGGLTLGITGDNLLPNSNCGAVPGIASLGEHYTSGEKMARVWFKDEHGAALHQTQMPRVPGGRFRGLAVSPLRTSRLDPPDIVLFYANPAQMILFINGLQWDQYKRFEFSITGESACADSWGRALSTREPSLSIPCYGERRYGGVADDELLMALPPSDFAKGISGLQALHQNGLRYPIMPYSASADPTDGLTYSYGKA